MIAFWVRSKFYVMGPRRYCICGEPVDCLGDLVLSYPVSLSGTKYGTRLMPRYPLNYAGAFHHTQPPLSMSLPLVNHPLLVISRAIFLSFTLLLLLMMTIPGEPMILLTPRAELTLH
jgi:hypothetical protein